MKITVINGSPKAKGSVSDVLIEGLLPKLSGQETQVLKIKNKTVSAAQLDTICQSDVLLLVFPLYADSLPSHMLHLLANVEAHGFAGDTTVYCLVNNGFYEGVQNEAVIKQMKVFAKKAGLNWGQGIGIGAGELHRALRSISLGRGINKNLCKALDTLAENIMCCATAEELFIVPNCPRFVWKQLAHTFMWRANAKANGVSKGEMYRRLAAEEPKS